MAKIQTFKDLFSWQEGHKLVLVIYSATKSFPKEEVFGLTGQMRRAAVSITSNIAEGFGRPSAQEKSRFYSIARGSLIELQNQLEISKDVGYLSKEAFSGLSAQIDCVHKLLNGLRRSAGRLSPD
jgi:four helix bundle protein